MKLKKLAASLATAATLMVSAGSAQALTVAGVTWDPSYVFDFRSVASVFENTASEVGQVISGHGQVSQVNNSLSFCTNCEVTYTFGGFELTAIDFAARTFSFKGGWVNVHVDVAQNFDPTNPLRSDDGALWLSLLAIDQPNLPGSTLIGNLTNIDPGTLGGSGNSYLEVVYAGTGGNPETAAGFEGVANAFLDTDNALNQCVLTAGVYCPDMFFNSSFEYDGELAAATDGALTHQGSSTLRGNTAEIPEPGALALLGLGLVGVGAVRRMKKAA